MSMQEFSDNLSTLSYVQKRRVPAWFYDSKTGAFLGRSANRWILLLTFYVIYYSCLTAFVSFLLYVFMNGYVPEDKPARTGEHNLLQFKAGLGYRPLVDVKKSLIKFAVADPQSYALYTENINAFLEYYNAINAKPDGQFGDCNSTERKDVSKACKFPLTVLGPCNSANNYGYAEGKPCIIMKLNKIYGWLPDVADPSMSAHPLINCTGQTPADDSNMGQLAYYPGVTHEGESYGYFDNNYFPFIGQAGYLSPIVALKFESPKKHVIILVRCRVRNLKNAADQELNFEVLVD